MTSLRIIHCFRSPVGGIFRHVRDLIHEQVKEGHAVGVICDSNSGGDFEDKQLNALQPALKLGLHRLPMDRSIGLRDLLVIKKLYTTLKALDVNVLHSHGAKGGAYARLIGSALGKRGVRPARLYCLHGGSIHYDQSRVSGKIYFSLERFLERFTDRLIFVSGYERDGYLSKVGEPPCPYSLVRNGLQPEEFDPVPTQPDARDFLYIGMMRDLKGVDLFLNALANTSQNINAQVSATLVGDGPDLERYKQMAEQLGNKVTTTFHAPMPARDAFGLGKTLVVPSRAESMPYIVLEALAAQRSILATNVGGIPEIFGPYHSELVEPDNLDALTSAMVQSLDGTRAFTESETLQSRVLEEFSVAKMSGDILKAYFDTLDAKQPSIS